MIVKNWQNLFLTILYCPESFHTPMLKHLLNLNHYFLHNRCERNITEARCIHEPVVMMYIYILLRER